MSKKSAYILLQHKRTPLGTSSFPIMVFTDLSSAVTESKKLTGTLPGTTFTVAITGLK
jgi:hypothetical protein